MYRQFLFEGDIHASLDCVPMAVRRKLDLACLKISLAGWQTLARADRLALCHLPVDGSGDLAVYTEVLQGFAKRVGVELKPLPLPDERWSPVNVPVEVAARCEENLIPLDRTRWTALDEDTRYALVKLADPKREPAKFLAAAAELLELSSRPVLVGLSSTPCGTVAPPTAVPRGLV